MKQGDGWKCKESKGWNSNGKRRVKEEVDEKEGGGWSREEGRVW